MALLETDPRDLLLDANNDLVFEGGDLVLSRGVPGVAQACRIALLMFAGEWFLDLDAGIPYWQSILGQKPAVAKAAAKIAVREALQSVEGVLEITKLEVNFVGASRTLTVTWAVRCAFGETPADTLALPSIANGGA